jgi:hypothetical protein
MVVGLFPALAQPCSPADSDVRSLVRRAIGSIHALDLVGLDAPDEDIGPFR